MNFTTSAASLWRIEFARKLSRAHANRPGCEFVVLEVLDLVERNMPELDPGRLRRLLAIRLQPCAAPPPMEPDRDA
jgi:hypothetical protein